MASPIVENDRQIPEDNLNLRRAIYKLKLENSRIKQKLKSLSATVRKLIEVSDRKDEIQANAVEAEKDYDEIGRDYILIGGPGDPFSIQYGATIKDSDDIQHKSAERYFWYKKAEQFNDTEAMKKICDAASGMDAENAMKEIKGFNDKAWDKVKMTHWEEAQRLKLEQTRWIANLLIVSGTTYIANASRDKQIGTGWGKKREESAKPWMWDGENLGGKFLMNYRESLKETHTWLSPNEEKEARNKYNELKPTWRRSDVMAKRGSRFLGGGGGSNFVRKQPRLQQIGGIREPAMYNQPVYPSYSTGASNNINLTSEHRRAYGYHEQNYQWV